MFKRIKKILANIILIKKSDSITLINHYGQGLYVFENQRIAGKLKLNIFESNELAFMSEYVKPDDYCMDVGANIGAYTVLFAAKSREVLSIEPVLKNTLLLRLTVDLNRHANVKIINCLASDVLGEVDLLTGKESGFSGIYVGEEQTEYLKKFYDQDVIGVSKCSSLTIDSLALKKLDIVKIDVEGAELKVINGSLNTIKSLSPRLIMIEVVDAAMRLYSDTMNDLMRVMSSVGYVPNILVNGNLISYSQGMYVPNDNLFFTKRSS